MMMTVILMLKAGDDAADGDNDGDANDGDDAGDAADPDAEWIFGGTCRLTDGAASGDDDHCQHLTTMVILIMMLMALFTMVMLKREVVLMKTLLVVTMMLRMMMMVMMLLLLIPMFVYTIGSCHFLRSSQHPRTSRGRRLFDYCSTRGKPGEVLLMTIGVQKAPPAKKRLPYAAFCPLGRLPPLVAMKSPEREPLGADFLSTAVVSPNAAVYRCRIYP